MASASDNDQGSSDTNSKRRKTRKKSYIWEHFTLQSLGSGCTRACCKQCLQTFAYSSGSKFAGTSHLKRHLALGICLKNREKKQQLSPYTPATKSGGSTAEQPRKRRYRMSSNPSLFDQDRSCHDLAKMIILHEYPLHMVEDAAFKTFIEDLQPQFRMETFSTIEGECLAVYQKEKENLMQLLGTISGRISLSLDPWTSSQSLRYMCVTGQFIDNDWKLHRRILNFMLVSSHIGSALTDSVGTCLSNWNMGNKLFSIALDNGSSNDGISSDLRGQLSNKNALVLNGQLFVASFAHILNAIVQDGLGAVHEIVYKIRESIKYVKSLSEEKFTEVEQELQIPSMKSLVLDVSTQWNTTYLMLLVALECTQVFSHLAKCDSNYSQAPSAEEWNKVETLCKYLKVIYDAANVFTSVSCPTANLYFHEAWRIKLELTQGASVEDARTIIGKMQEKYEQYWKDCSLILAIAVVMDPRFKMKLVEFSFSKIYGEEASTFVKVVNDGLHDLYLEYASEPTPQTPTDEEQGLANSVEEQGLLGPPNNATEGTIVSDNVLLLDFDVFISELSASQPVKSELDQYLEESILPRVREFEILDWWKLNKRKYPTLSKMARDVLAIPMSTIAPELIFNTGSRVLNDYRSSLQPETLEALVCAKDWLEQELQQQPPASRSDLSKAIVKMEL